MKNLSVLLFLWLPLLSYAQIVFVDSSAVSGQNTGADWANAYTDLLDALETATAGTEIWVAKGTYFPTAGIDREIYFHLPGNVALLGGFEGGESNINERDWELNKTSLSGDIGVTGDSTDNSYTVLYASDTGSDTRLDGFTVEWGTANSSVPLDPASGLKKSGGGLFIRGENTHAQLNISNCTFQNNTAAANGGAVFLINESNNTSVNAYFENCQFYENTAAFGGAISKIGGGHANFVNEINNCRFEFNKAISGGAIYISNTYGANPIQILNSTFYYNYATYEGGAIGLQHYVQDNNIFEIDSCIFEGNYSPSGGALSLFTYNIVYSIRLFKSQFINNFAGAILILTLIEPDIIIESCTFFLNTGWRVVDGPFSEINNCLFARNESGSILIPYYFPFPFTSTINNCTFSSNSTSGSGGVLFIQSDKIKVHFNNSILTNNTAEFGANIATTSSFGNDTIRIIMNNCLTDFDSCLDGMYVPSQGAPGIIECNAMIYNQYPLFRDTANLDFSLLACSPAIDAGDNAYVNGLTDIAGNDRIINGTVDIGAYEAPASFLSIDTLTDAACFGDNSGSVGFSYIGQAPFSTQWANGTTTGSGTDSLAAGSYSLTVTDANNCSETITFEIGQVASLAASFNAHHVTCPNGNDGSARVTIQGGVPDYFITWSSGVMSDSTGLLTGGWHYVTITDGNDCELIDSVFIEEPAAIFAYGDITNASTSGSSDGAVEIFNIIGGTPPFHLEWNTGDTTALIDNLVPGVYVVTVTDASGCTAQHGFLVSFLTGVEEIASSGFSLSPNPVSGQAQISFFHPLQQHVRLRLFNAQGQQVWEQQVPVGSQGSVLDFDGLSTGFYTVALEVEGRVAHAEKVVKL